MGIWTNQVCLCVACERRWMHVNRRGGGGGGGGGRGREGGQHERSRKEY